MGHERATPRLYRLRTRLHMTEPPVLKLTEIALHLFPVTISFSAAGDGQCLHMQVIHDRDEVIAIPYFKGPLMLRMDYADGATYERAI